MAKEELKPGNPQERVDAFDKEMGLLQQKHGVAIYATLQAFENGEVHPIIKVRDTLTFNVVNDTKTHENKAKEGDIACKEA